MASMESVDEMGLKWIEGFSEYAIWLVMPYLTGVWRLDLIDAAVIINLYSGATKIMPMGMLFLSDSILGHFKTIIASTFFSIFGLGFLLLSTPPAIAKATGACSNYGPECITTPHKILFYIGLSLTAIGVSGYKASKNPFRHEHKSKKSESEDRPAKSCNVFNFLSVYVIPIAGVIAMGYVKPWAIIFGIALVCAVLAAVVFLSSAFRYDYRGPQEGSSNAMSRIYHSIRLIPLCLTFMACGLVLSVGDTYFLEGAKHLRSKVVSINTPITLIKTFSDVAKTVVVSMYACFEVSFDRYGPPVSIGASMVLSIFCCLVASSVEARRLGVVWSHGLIDKPDETVPMNVFWVMPQYMLLGALEGLFQKSVERFAKGQVRSHLTRYVEYFTNALFGLGIMGSALSVHITNVMTGKDGKTEWFGETLNKSRLDKYYLLLALISAGNLVVFVVLAPCYRHSYGNPRQHDEDSERQHPERYSIFRVERREEEEEPFLY